MVRQGINATCRGAAAAVAAAPLSLTQAHENAVGFDAAYIKEKTGPLDLDQAIAYVNSGQYGNMACLFTSSGSAARKFRYEVQAGNIGINIGVAAPMAFFPFSGWKESFFGTLHAQSSHGVEFYTQTKVVVERWLKENVGSSESE